MSSSSKHPSIPPLLAIPFGILAVSTASIFIRYAQVYAPSLVIAAYRLTLATLVLAPVVIRDHRDALSRLSKRKLLLAALSGVFLAIHFATWITSLEYTTVASSVVLVSTSPLWVALFSPLILRERIDRIVIVGMGIALFGSVIVGLSDSCILESGRLQCPTLADFLQGEAFLGDVLALAGALAASGYLLIGRRLRSGMSLITYVFLVYGLAALTLLIVVLASGLALIDYPPVVYLWFLLLAIVPQLIGHSTFNWALRYLSAAFVSVTLLGEPIGSSILAYFLLAETPTPMKIIGAILILAGIYTSSRSETPQTAVEVSS
jgi:drug/metabolite transporter (DMT)-like permease